MLPSYSVKRPFTVVVAVVGVLLVGAIAFMNMTPDLLPSMNLPYAMVMTTYVGASPETVEQVVTRPIEQAMATTPNIKTISSISGENLSLVILEYHGDTNMDSTVLEISQTLNQIHAAWNDDAISAPTIMKFNPEMLPIMLASVDMEGRSAAEVSRWTEEAVIPYFERIEGVASVSAAGLVEEQVQVEINEGKIEALNDRILRAIDSGLADTRQKLEDARAELDSQRAQLEEEVEAQRGQLLSARYEVNMGLGQLNAGLTQIDEGERKLEEGRLQLVTAIQAMEEQQTQLQQSEQALAALGSAISQEQSLQLVALRQGLQDLSAQLEQAKASLAEIDAQLAALADQRAQLMAQKGELEQHAAQIRSGLAVIDDQVAEARAALEAGEAELDAQQEKFDEARDAAFEQARLDGVITPEMVSALLQAENFALPAGYISVDGQQVLVRVGDKFKNVDQVRDLVLMAPGLEGVETVRLSDVADVSLINDSDDVYAKVNGNEAVILTFQKQNTYSTTRVSRDIRDQMAALEEENPGVHMTVIMDQGDYINIVVDSVWQNVFYGGFLAILILLVFLRDIRPTVVVAASIPISIIFSLAIMYLTGITLNVISLAGLALAVGMLVDNAIVVIENIYRLRSEGLSAAQAAIRGTRQVAGAIVSATLTTMVVFLPIVFTQGITRELFTDMGLTIAFSLLASLLVALTLVPSMASITLRRPSRVKATLPDNLVHRYDRALRWCITHKVVPLLLAGLLFAGSVVYAFFIGTSFLPETDSNQLSVTLQMPSGSTSEDLPAMADTVMERILALPDVETVGASQNMGIGMLGGLSGASNSLYMYVILKDGKAKSSQQVGREILDATADLDCTLDVNTSNMDVSALTGSGIEAMIKGPDIDTLRRLAVDVADILSQVPGAQNISTGLEEPAPELRITVDKEKAMTYGLTVAQVYAQVGAVVSGGTTATTLTVSNQDFPVVVTRPTNASSDWRALESLELQGNRRGEPVTVKLHDIAYISRGEGLAAIRRENQQRTITVTAGVGQDYNVGLVNREFERRLADYPLPEGYTIELSGENEVINTTLRDLIYMVALSLVLIYLIMVAQFQSLMSPFIIMFIIPMAFTGGMLGLMVGRMELSAIAMLGFLMLAGVVVNNGIVMVDYINQLRWEGMEKREAIVQAAKTRMRPILMTALTTILGLSTLAGGVGMGADMLQPLAVVSIGGLLYATLLTLFIVPALYDLMGGRLGRKPRDLAEEEEA